MGHFPSYPETRTGKEGLKNETIPLLDIHGDPLGSLSLGRAYGIRETYRGTDHILAGRTAEAREVFLRASRYCHYLEDLVDYCDACGYYDDGDLSSAATKAYSIRYTGFDPEAKQSIQTRIQEIRKAEQDAREAQEAKERAHAWAKQQFEKAKNVDWNRQKSQSSSSTFRPTSRPSASSDPYNARDYSGADEFYDDHYDDFFDYEDAEDYWYGNH